MTLLMTLPMSLLKRVFRPAIRAFAANTTFVQNLDANLGAAPTTFSSFTTAKTVIPQTSLRTIGQNEMYIGKAYRFHIWGAISNIVTTPGTITFQLMIGGLVAYTSGAIQMVNVAGTLLPFHIEGLFIVRAIGTGTSANGMGMAEAVGEMFVKAAGGVASAQGDQAMMFPETTPAVGAGFDSTINNTVDLWAGFSISNAANSVRIEMFTFEELN